MSHVKGVREPQGFRVSVFGIVCSKQGRYRTK